MKILILIAIGSALVNNVVLSQFLGRDQHFLSYRRPILQGLKFLRRASASRSGALRQTVLTPKLIVAPSCGL